MAKKECAWCLKEKGQDPDPEASHGICDRHEKQFLEQLESRQAEPGKGNDDETGNKC